MRVLSLLAVAVAGCYDPPVKDCQFTCPDNQCPGDLTCMAGVCRTAGGSGSCTGSGGSSCPAPPSGCALASTSGLCLAVCSAATDWNAAERACGAASAWQIAVLDTSSALSAGEDALRAAAATWIGLTRAVNPLDWEWRTGGGTVSSNSSDWSMDSGHSGNSVANLCAAIDHGKLYSDECDVSHAYACAKK